METFSMSRSNIAGSARTSATLLISAATLLGGCLPYQARAPEGFAALEEKRPFRALTPERVIYRVRHEPNEPRADLTFWRKALKQRMDEAGYVFVAEQEIKASTVPGYLLELAAPFGEQDYSYLIALFVRDSQLVIAETTGEVSKVRKRRAAILEAIESLQL
jgi:hypothetical protein